MLDSLACHACLHTKCWSAPLAEIPPRLLPAPKIEGPSGIQQKNLILFICPTYNLDEILSLLSPSSVFRPVLKGRCEGPICVESEHTEIDRRRGKPAAAIHCLYLVGFMHVLFSSLFVVAPMRFLSLHPLLLTLCSDFNLRSRSLN